MATIRSATTTANTAAVSNKLASSTTSNAPTDTSTYNFLVTDPTDSITLKFGVLITAGTTVSPDVAAQTASKVERKYVGRNGSVLPKQAREAWKVRDRGSASASYQYTFRSNLEKELDIPSGDGNTYADFGPDRMTWLHPRIDVTQESFQGNIVWGQTEVKDSTGCFSGFSDCSIS
ncbi:hypothetical protein BCR39DRAFT_502706 [Naematelia encephala]|uniref:Uncharacterized protein n=1 Tax=Naematelia encephala TaxID=71784 RepID=A0A1Y2BML2_9TREE|nr:hypothetical protein BCR39DRAFT_502706 [Naematelia encephala]